MADKKIDQPVSSGEDVQQSNPLDESISTHVPFGEDVSKTTEIEGEVSQSEPAVELKIGEEVAAAEEEKLSEEEGQRIIDERYKLPFQILALKIFSIVFLAFSVVAFFILSASLDESNKYFSLFGMSENLTIKHKHLKKQENSLSRNDKKLTKENNELRNRIDNKEFFIHRNVVKLIKDQRLNWVDREADDGKMIFGLIDGINRIQSYFNSSDYVHPIISGNSIKIEKISFTRDVTKFSVSATNIFGKIFYLSSEFIEMMNSSPLFKGGEILKFSRKTSKEGDEEMNFSLVLNNQRLGDKDPSDARFNEYLKWLGGEDIDTSSETKSARPRRK